MRGSNFFSTCHCAAISRSFFPKTDREASEIGGAERGGFSHDGTHHRNTQNISLELAEEIIAGRAAVNAQLFGFDSRIALHAFHYVARLIGHRFERGAGEMRPRGSARQPDNCAARLRIPIRRAEADESSTK